MAGLRGMLVTIAICFVTCPGVDRDIWAYDYRLFGLLCITKLF
jgi:hypothetical protein